MPNIVSIYSKHACYVLRLLNRTDSYVWLYQKNLWLFIFEMHLISGIIDGWQRCEPPRPPCQAKCKNVKTGPNVACILVFTIRLISVDCCFFAFFVVCSGDFGFLYSGSIPDLLLCIKYFLSVSQSGLPSAKFPPWLKPLVASLHLVKARL